MNGNSIGRIFDKDSTILITGTLRIDSTRCRINGEEFPIDEGDFNYNGGR
ncbi:MAG: hypothetical protein R2771_00830 [Saprospiraceae bacterium]